MVVQCTLTAANGALATKGNLWHSKNGQYFDTASRASSFGSDGDCASLGGSTHVPLVSDAVFSEVPMRTKNLHRMIGTPLMTSEDSTKYLLLSEDEGKHFSCASTNVMFEKVIPHPSKDDWFLAQTKMSLDTYAFDLYFCKVTGKTRVSCDKLKSLVTTADWAVASTSDAVMLVTQNTGEGVSGFVLLEHPDGAKSEVPNAPKMVDKFIQSTQCEMVFLIGSANEQAAWGRDLYVSKDAGRTFNVAKIALDGRHQHIEVIDATRDLAMIAVDTMKTHFEGQVSLSVESPSSKQYPAMRAAFTAPIVDEDWNGHAAEIYYNAVEGSQYGCSWKPGEGRKKVLVAQRGVCKFHEKAMAAQQAGARALVVINTDPTHKLYMSAPDEAEAWPEIPVIIISSEDGEELLKLYNAGGLTVRPKEDDIRETTLWGETNLFVSDESGIYYSASLKDVNFRAAVTYGQDEYVDVFKVESSPGTYLANFENHSHAEHPSIITVVTNNYGGHWRVLQQPDGRDRREGESLHLALASANAGFSIPLPRSSPQAVGIVVANGWVDDHIPISDQKESARTYISRDGGSSWEMAEIEDSKQAELTEFAGFHDYRILDHGSVIVFIPKMADSKYVAFSVDEGRGDLFLLDTRQSAVSFEGIITEPGSKTTKVYLYDHKAANVGGWGGVAVDFSPILSSQCTGDKDYKKVQYTPNQVHTQCVLGSKVMLNRKLDQCTRNKKHNVKVAKQCLNGLDYDKLVDNRTKCQCTAYDFKCAPGFFRRSSKMLNSGGADAPCERDLNSRLSSVCGAEPGKSIEVKPYERLPMDDCTKGSDDIWDKTFVIEHCHRAAKVKDNEVAKGFAYFFLFIIILCGTIVAVLVFSQDARDTTMRLLGTEHGVLGAIGKFLSGFECFRQMSAGMVYSELSIQAEPLNENPAFDGEDDEDERDEDAEMNDILFGLDDNNIEGADGV